MKFQKDEFKTVSSVNDFLKIVGDFIEACDKNTYYMCDYELLKDAVRKYLKLYNRLSFNIYFREGHKYGIMRICRQDRIYSGNILSTSQPKRRTDASKTIFGEDLLSKTGTEYKRYMLNKEFESKTLKNTYSVISYLDDLIADYEFELHDNFIVNNTDYPNQRQTLINRLEVLFTMVDEISLKPKLDIKSRLVLDSDGFKDDGVTIYDLHHKSENLKPTLVLNTEKLFIKNNLTYKNSVSPNSNDYTWVSYTDCELCGSRNTNTTKFKVGKEKKDVCHRCFRQLLKNTKGEYIADSGIVYYGIEAQRQKHLDDREKTNKKLVEEGIKFRCRNCKRYCYVKSKSANKKVDICKSCSKYFTDMSDIEKIRKNSYKEIETLKALKEKKRSMTAADKEEAANKEKDMIATFLSKKNKST